jgi:hypothetical protein
MPLEDKAKNTPITLRAKPLLKHYSSTVRWMLTGAQDKIKMMEMLDVTHDFDEFPSEFGICHLEEIHAFWGPYAIVTLQTHNQLLHINNTPCYMFWIETNSLDLPSELILPARQAYLLNPYFRLDTY